MLLSLCQQAQWGGGICHSSLVLLHHCRSSHHCNCNVSLASYRLVCVVVCGMLHIYVLFSLSLSLPLPPSTCSSLCVGWEDNSCDARGWKQVVGRSGLIDTLLPVCFCVCPRFLCRCSLCFSPPYCEEDMCTVIPGLQRVAPPLFPEALLQHLHFARSMQKTTEDEACVYKTLFNAVKLPEKSMPEC